jgi:hypothetical protein
MAENIDVKMNGQDQAPAPESTRHAPDTPEQPAAKRLKVDGLADSKGDLSTAEATREQPLRDAQSNGNGEPASQPNGAPADRRAGMAPIKKE